MTMPHDDGSATMRCQARPRAARPDYREDMLCASAASAVVLFCGLSVAVCRIHETMYQRWGAAAEERAGTVWGWIPALAANLPV
jgi:hypothetical protein